MAIEAKHLNFFPGRLIQTPTSQMNVISGFPGIPFGASPLPENHCFYPPVIGDSIQAKTSVNTDSGLTYNIPAPRKRSRDSTNQLYALPNYPAHEKQGSISQLPSFAGEDILQQYQSEIDAVIFQHSKKIRLELQERQKQQTRMLAAALGDGVMKKLNEKDEQIQKMGKLNIALQERVKSLYVENQLWRDLAQSNEAAANSLRTNLEQVLLHVGGTSDRFSDGGGTAAAAAEEDAESCCGSSDNRGGDDKEDDGSSCYGDRKCKMCGERESCVLILPCRHLCLCGVCGSGSRRCPVCNASMNATLHVNMSF